MQWWEILLGVISFIIALGVLIGIHELGHLAAAKAFHVYCFNYSIGFGPKLLSTKKSAKHETTWSLRAVPLGGFVSMYGEGMENEDSEFIPLSRSLEGVARYKRAIIVSAGVFLNFVLGFVLILLHNGCFPHISFSFPQVDTYKTAMVCNYSDEFKKNYSIQDGDALSVQMDPLTGVFLIDENIKLSTNDDTNNHVLCMSNTVTTTKKDPLLTDSLAVYPKKSIDDVVNDAINANNFSNKRLANFMMANGDKRSEKEIIEEIKKLSKEEKKTKCIEVCKVYYANLGFSTSVDTTKKFVLTNSNVKVTTTLTFYNQNNTSNQDVTLTLTNEKKSVFKDSGIYLKRFFERYDAAKTFSSSWNEWCGANTAVFRGLGMLFTGQGNVSGPIGIAQMSTNILANFGFERYLYLWGMISCNLAILNLLPFPGLDGWTLVVIAYEGLTKKQIPTKVKGIISLIGLGLLFFLMIFIIIKDIVGLF